MKYRGTLIVVKDCRKKSTGRNSPEENYPETEYVNRIMTHSWEQKVVRFYDPDGNLIEVGTPV